MAENTYKRRFGDRKEGRQVRSLPAFNKLIPYVMVKKNDACNYFTDSLEVTEIDRFLREKRTEGYKGLGLLHLFIAAYIRTVAHVPGLNRFISGQRIFNRKNIQVVLTVKRALTSEATETTIKVDFLPTDTIFDVYRKMNESIDEVKADSGDNGAEKAADTLFKIPGLFLKFAIWFLNFLDYFDWLPKSLLGVSPFHGSMIISDLGSLGIPPIYHHIYNFGNLPLFITFGAKRKAYELNKSGQPVERKYVDYTVVSDERILDGQVYATAFKFIKYYLYNPRLLEQQPEKVEEDVF